MTSNGTVQSVQERYSQLAFAIRFYPEYVTMDRYCTPIWYILGFFGNTLSAFVWMQPGVRKGNSSAIYLAALSIWDLLFLVFHSMIELKLAWSIDITNTPIICEIFYVPAYTAQFMSPLLVMAFSVERWISVCFPFKRESLCTPKRAKITVIVLSIGCFLWNSAQVYFNTYDSSLKECISRRNMENFWMTYSLISEVCLTGIVPVATLIFNLLVIQALYKITLNSKRTQLGVSKEAMEQNQRMERRARSTTVMLLCVSFYVILTTLPAGLAYCLQPLAETGNSTMTDEGIIRDPVWTRYIRFQKVKKIIDELTVSHYSINFIIYLITGDQYRNQVRQLLCSGLHQSTCMLNRHSKRKRELLEKERFFMENSLTHRANRERNKEDSPQTESIRLQSLNGTEPVNHDGHVKPLLATYI